MRLNVLFWKNVLVKHWNIEGRTKQKDSRTYFQCKPDIAPLKAELKFLDLFYSSYRKPARLFLMKPAASLMFVYGVCVCVCVSAEWQVSELSAVLTLSPPAVFNQYHSVFQPSHMATHTRITHTQTLCNIFLWDILGIPSMSNFTLLLSE